MLMGSSIRFLTIFCQYSIPNLFQNLILNTASALDLLAKRSRSRKQAMFKNMADGRRCKNVDAGAVQKQILKYFRILLFLKNNRFCVDSRTKIIMRQIKSFFIRTYGCQMNELDSEIMVGQLEKRGLTRTDEESEADLLIFNTCSIRDLAERKVMGKIGRIDAKDKKRHHRGHWLHGHGKKRDSFPKTPPYRFRHRDQ